MRCIVVWYSSLRDGAHEKSELDLGVAEEFADRSCRWALLSLLGRLLFACGAGCGRVRRTFDGSFENFHRQGIRNDDC